MNPYSPQPDNRLLDLEVISSRLARMRPEKCGFSHDLIGHSFCPNPAGDCAHGSDLSIRVAINSLSPLRVISSTFSHKANILIFDANTELGALDVGAQDLHGNLKNGRKIPTWISDEIPDVEHTIGSVRAALKILQSKAFEPKSALIECLMSVNDLVQKGIFEKARLLAEQFEVRMDLYLALSYAHRSDFNWNAGIKER